MSAPGLPEGYVVRTPTYTDDGIAELDAVVSLLAACDIAVVGEVDTGRDEVLSMFTSPSNDRERTVLVDDADGVLVGLVWVELDATAGESWFDVYVDPTRATSELYDLGFAHGVSAASAHKAGAGAATWEAWSGCFAQDEALNATLQRNGFQRRRRFWRMRIDTQSTAVPAAMPDLPRGATLVVARSEEERRRVCALHNESFTDHWMHVGRPWEEWVAHVEAHHPSPDGWWLLQVDGVDAAVCMLDESRADQGGGYVGVLGVLREFRGRGLATHLLQRAFVRSREEGRSWVGLSVDSDSPTGAQHLYESVGMTPYRIIDAFSRPST
jgi:ribosomal protein S18 acetylase RimI-like enzyme